MKIKLLSVKNFMSVGDAQVTYDGQGLVLIEGDNQDKDSFESNGAGKSTFLQALFPRL
jgi:DNA repair exonuclease SbcCD ATPase subunit